MTFFDRTLDALVLTHPDQDHIGGATDILDRYDVKNIIEPDVSNDTRAWVSTVDAIEAEVREGARHLVAHAPQRLILGGGAYADILFPTRNVANVKDTNAGSVVMRVVYGDTSIMLTGDAPTSVEQELFFVHGYGLDSDVLKAGHHGSKTSSLPDFVESVSPTYVVFSRGCDNRYGHPAPTVVSFFDALSVSAFDTCTNGDITFISNGQTLEVRP
jgi:competence protein ComEC